MPTSPHQRYHSATIVLRLCAASATPLSVCPLLNGRLLACLPPHARTQAPAASDITQCFGCAVVAAQSSATRLALRTQGPRGLPVHNKGIGFRVEGPAATQTLEGGRNPPQPTAITCDAKMPPPPAPPPPPWCGLRPHYAVLKRDDNDKGRNGRESPLFEAEINLDVWEAGAELTVECRACEQRTSEQRASEQRASEQRASSLSLHAVLLALTPQ